MHIGKTVFFVMVLVMAGLFSAGAEEKYGIKMYDGAKYDAAVSKSVSESMSINIACYRTNDPVVKVIEFFKKQAGLEYVGGDKENALFKKGSIDVTIQTPWMDLKSGKMMKDTLISIVKQ